MVKLKQSSSVSFRGKAVYDQLPGALRKEIDNRRSAKTENKGGVRVVSITLENGNEVSFKLGDGGHVIQQDRMVYRSPRSLTKIFRPLLDKDPIESKNTPLATVPKNRLLAEYPELPEPFSRTLRSALYRNGKLDFKGMKLEGKGKDPHEYKVLVNDESYRVEVSNPSKPGFETQTYKITDEKVIEILNKKFQSVMN